MANIRTHWLSRGSKISGCASILGSWQICHNVCTSLVAALATLGIAVSGMPLLFLNRFQLPIWIAAVALFGVLLLIRATTRMRCITTRGMAGNVGLLLAGLPFSGTWLGGARTAGLVVVLFVLFWYLKDLIVKREEAGWVVDFVEQGRKVGGALVGVVAVIGLLTIGGDPISVATEIGSPSIATPRTTSRMKFTLFDTAHAKELMDKNSDGQCDACGMAIDQCIESGMMECTMDANAKIGLLGSAHIHARLTVLRNGKSMDLAPFAHTMDAQSGGTGSSFIHVEGPDFNKLHMHATGVPLELFFDSIGLVTDGAAVSVNGKKVGSGLRYVFKDGDIIEVRF